MSSVSIKLIAGRAGQEFNQRKCLKGVFREDRYHARRRGSSFQMSGIHGSHYGEGRSCDPLIRMAILWVQRDTRAQAEDCPDRDYQRLTELLGFDIYDEVRIYHKRWVDDYLENERNTREEK